MRILISGAGGLVGSALVASLTADGHTAGRLDRRGAGGPASVAWNPETGPDPAALRGWDAIVHLAGKNLATLWTADAKRALRDSRVAGTAGIARAMAAAGPEGPRVLVSASAIGYYGSRGDEVLPEDAPPGSGFLSEVCQEWEAAADPARDAGIRVAHARFGLIFAREDGPLAKMLTPFRLGLGGRLGDGRQWMSWVMLEDVVGALRFLLEDAEAAGAFNITAPEPARNEEFTRTLGRVLGRPTVFPVPAFLLRALPGGMGEQMFLGSQKVIPVRLTERGFTFQHPELESALRSVLT